MPFSLQRHVALVTGNSTGLGQTIGLALGQVGSKVRVNYYINEGSARRTGDDYSAAGIDTVGIRADVTAEAGVDELFAKTEQAFGNVESLEAHARCEDPLKRIAEYDWAF